MDTTLFYILFNLAILGALVADLGLFNRSPHAPSVKEATLTSLFWIVVAMVFGAGIWMVKGPVLGMQWFTAYTMEKALSVDNLFIFSLIFGYFKIKAQYRHKVLFYGILGALTLRTGMLVAGVTLVSTFHWLLYLFGAFLLYTGGKMLIGALKGEEEENDVEDSWGVRIARWLVPVHMGEHKGKFMLKVIRLGKSDLPRGLNGKPYPAGTTTTYVATTMLIALVAVEISDVVFAVDSIPVVLAVTQDFMVAYTATVFAILGLRSLFFVLEHLLSRLRYLPLALGTVLAFIGFKMLIADFAHISVGASLAVVLLTLALATVASVLNPKE